MTDKKPKKPEPKASVTIKEFLGVPKKAPLLVDVEVPPALAAAIPREPKLSAEDKARLSAAIPLGAAMASEEAAAHVTAKYEKHAATVGAPLAAPIDLRAVCACCGNRKPMGLSGEALACVVCGN